MIFEFLICIILLFIVYSLFSSIGYILCMQANMSNYDNLIFYFFGKCFFIIILTFFYSQFNLSIEYSVLFLIFFGACSIIFMIYKKISLIKELVALFFKFYFPIFIILFSIAYAYGPSFYVFRGNHWDWLAQISLGTVFNQFNWGSYIELINNEILTVGEVSPTAIGKPYSKSFYFFPIDGPNHRISPSLFFSSIFMVKNISPFLLAYTIKVLFFTSIFPAYYILIKSFDNKLGRINNYIIALAFSLSTWSFYIFEIDALAQLQTFSISIIFYTLLLELYKQQADSKVTIYQLSFFASAVFLSYPEQAMIIFFSTSIFIILYLRLLFKKLYFYLAIFFFIILILPKLITYVELVSSMSSATNDWWGYFGSFILGRNNLVLDPNAINSINEIINNSNNNILYKIKEIFIMHIDQGYSLILLTILPSLLGFYYLADASFNFLNFLFLILLNMFLMRIIFINTKGIIFTENKNLKFIRFFLLFQLCACITFLLKNQLYISIKIFFYLAPFISIFTLLIFKKRNRVNYILIVLTLLFPIYKFSEYNFGIGKHDSFPSILNVDLKKNIDWEFNISNIKNCKFIEIDINKQIPNIYISIILSHKNIDYFNNSKFTNQEYKLEQNMEIDCKIFLKNKKFKVSRLISTKN